MHNYSRGAVSIAALMERDPGHRETMNPTKSLQVQQLTAQCRCKNFALAGVSQRSCYSSALVGESFLSECVLLWSSKSVTTALYSGENVTAHNSPHLEDLLGRKKVVDSRVRNSSKMNKVQSLHRVSWVSKAFQGGLGLFGFVA